MPDSLGAQGLASGSNPDYAAMHAAQVEFTKAQANKLNAEAESIKVWTVIAKHNNEVAFK